MEVGLGLSTTESGTGNVNVKVVYPFLLHGAISLVT